MIQKYKFNYPFIVLFLYLKLDLMVTKENIQTNININPNPIEYVWAHAVNNEKDLMFALYHSDITAIEADIIFSINKNIPVMGHPPLTDNDFTLSIFLNLISDHFLSNLNHSSNLKNKQKTIIFPIIKLDFKSSKAYESSIVIIKEFLLKCKAFPKELLFINADILKGSGTSPLSLFQSKRFIQLTGNELEDVMLSIGWTMDPLNEKLLYTKEMIMEMIDLLKDNQDIIYKVTFPIRAINLRHSWDNIKLLYDFNPNFGLTLWWNTYELSMDELNWIYNTLENNNLYKNRTFYDILGWNDFIHKYNNIK